MLDTLLEAETNNQIEESGILEEVETFMFEGFDTTSSGITFLLLMLALHQDVQQNVYNEILEEIGSIKFIINPCKTLILIFQ